MGKYDNNTPMMDSTPGSEGYRDSLGEGGDKIDETSVVLVWTENDQRLCKCGCGEKMETKSDFRQGHDARLKGILQRAHVRGSEVIVIEGSHSSGTAMAWAERRGWERFLTKAEETAEKRSRSAARAKPGKSAGKTATPDLLGGMKAALRVLATIGRDKGERKIEVTRDNYQSILDGSHPEFAVHHSGLYESQIVKVNRRGWREAVITSITGDRAEIAYKTDGGKDTTAVVDVESILAWIREGK